MKERKCLYKDTDLLTKTSENDFTDTEEDLTLIADFALKKLKKKSGKKWVLLVAGSKGWENYQHQANVCCLYQIIKKNGIPDEQIVVMMYDDITQNKQNPANGAIVSAVRDTEEFQRTTLESGANDNIYIYMTGLGNEGTFEFPEESLSPYVFTDAIKNMSEKGKFSKMVIFMTSSYSATMFEDLNDDVNAYALTACDKNVQSCPSDFDDPMNIYLSDKFSSAWLNFIFKADFKTATFQNLVSDKQEKYLGTWLSVTVPSVSFCKTEHPTS